MDLAMTARAASSTRGLELVRGWRGIALFIVDAFIKVGTKGVIGGRHRVRHFLLVKPAYCNSPVYSATVTIADVMEPYVMLS